MTDSKVKFADLTTKKARVAYIREKLGSNHKWALQGMQKIFEAQTEDEKHIGATTEHNGVGFTGADAEFLTSLHNQFVRRGFLTPPQMLLLLKKMPKYAAQLERISTSGSK